MANNTTEVEDDIPDGGDVPAVSLGAQNGSANRSESVEETKNRKPGNTAFKQQRLPAWQPILTAGTVLPMFFLVGIIFIPLGVVFLVTSNRVQEQIIDYTNCIEVGGNETCASIVKNISRGDCKCSVDFELKEDFQGQVYLYYRLSSYYQNHRRYVNSRDDLQLLGQGVDNPSDTCAPYTRTNDTNKTAYAPCGAIANSLFNDTFFLQYRYDIGGNEEGVPLDYSGIAWKSDIEAKFQNPEPLDFNNTLSPPNWRTSIKDMPGQFQNESFVVWMRTAAFPTFRKLHSRVVQKPDSVFDKGLPAGNYTLYVDYNYPVTAFRGTKSLVLSTTSWLGGKNNFLGVAYIVTGSLCILFGIIFICVHVKYGNRNVLSTSTTSLMS